MGIDDILKREPEFRYGLLARLQADCEYFLGYGRGSERHLWAGDVKKHIETMKSLHKSFGRNEKPQWLTWNQILTYERNMLTLLDRQ